MTYLIVEIILLLLLAFVLGALLSWWFTRRGEGSHDAEAGASVDVSGYEARIAELEQRCADCESERSSLTSQLAAMPLAAAPANAGPPDDLKRISGVGAVIEKKLHDAGVTNYAQIAAWSATDIADINERLVFKGRIERENWVEQARTLAGGGETEFTKRYDSEDEG
ncbi:MAG: hypothetical protein AAFX09_03925 [Pseudomonadota bacterium]